MLNTDRATCACEALAGLFDYPAHDAPGRLAEARARVAEACPEAVADVDRLLDALSPLSPEAREELYVKTFDFAPLCAPYLGAHLFGEDGYKRSRFMAELAGACLRAGFDTAGELPDHLALVLRLLPSLDPGERDDLARYCLRPCANRMADLLDRAQNPWRHALRALIRVLDAEFPEETAHA